MTKYVNPQDERFFVTVEDGEVKSYSGFSPPDLAQVLSTWQVKEPEAPKEIVFSDTRKLKHYNALLSAGWPEDVARETAGI